MVEPSLVAIRIATLELSALKPALMASQPAGITAVNRLGKDA